MKSKVWIIVAGLAVVFSVLGCSVDVGDWGFQTVSGTGDVVSETRGVSGFSSVELAGWGNLTIQVGENESLRIEAEENLLQYIETEVENGKLVIRHRRRVLLRPTKAINYYLTVKDLESINVTGAGNVEVPVIAASRFSVQISGAGNVNIEGVEAERLDVGISGAGNVDVAALEADRLDVDISGAGALSVAEGEVRVQEIGVSGGGNYSAKGLQSAEAEIRLSGLGNAVVRVSDVLKVTISGAGSVQYAGQPTVEKSVSGVGKVERIGQ